MGIEFYIGILTFIILILVILCSDFDISTDDRPTDF